MGSGNKQQVINPRERAVSTDINRLQQYAAADLSAILRMLISGSVLVDDQGAAAPTYSATTDTPLTGKVLGGLLVRPQYGTVNTLVDAGVAYVVNPDVTPDPNDSAFKLVNDLGITNGAVLPLAPNTSGSTRVDVVECQRVDVVLASENRDIYDQISGLFTPELVNKTIAARFLYRIRAGTPGGGFPGAAAGWMPLMVAAVPTGSVTWDSAVRCWDVRPLVADSAIGLGLLSKRVPRGRCIAALGTGTTIITGMADSECNGQRAGGRLYTGYSAIDVASNSICEAGFAATANRPWYLYAIFPFGLPRWVGYTTGPTPMLPDGMRGIPVLSMTKPARMQGAPVGAVALPPDTLLGSSTTVGVCLCAGMDSAAGLPTTWFDDGVVAHQLRATSAPDALPATSFDGNTATFNFLEGTNFPANARAIVIDVAVVFADGGTGVDASLHNEFLVYDKTGAAVYAEIRPTTPRYSSSGHVGGYIKTQVRIPIDPDYLGSFPVTRKVIWAHDVQVLTNCTVGTAPTAQVVGWEMGP
jgi:hypothetical protein